MHWPGVPPCAGATAATLSPPVRAMQPPTAPEAIPGAESKAAQPAAAAARCLYHSAVREQASNGKERLVRGKCGLHVHMIAVTCAVALGVSSTSSIVIGCQIYGLLFLGSSQIASTATAAIATAATTVSPRTLAIRTLAILATTATTAAISTTAFVTAATAGTASTAATAARHEAECVCLQNPQLEYCNPMRYLYL